MNYHEASTWVGRRVRGKIIDTVQVSGGPLDRKLFLMCEGERIMNVTNLVPADIPAEEPNPALGGRHKIIDRRPEVKI